MFHICNNQLRSPLRIIPRPTHSLSGWFMATFVMLCWLSSTNSVTTGVRLLDLKGLTQWTTSNLPPVAKTFSTAITSSHSTLPTFITYYQTSVKQNIGSIFWNSTRLFTKWKTQNSPYEQKHLDILFQRYGVFTFALNTTSSLRTAHIYRSFVVLSMQYSITSPGMLTYYHHAIREKIRAHIKIVTVAQHGNEKRNITYLWKHPVHYR